MESRDYGIMETHCVLNLVQFVQIFVLCVTGVLGGKQGRFCWLCVRKKDEW